MPDGNTEIQNLTTRVEFLEGQVVGLNMICQTLARFAIPNNTRPAIRAELIKASVNVPADIRDEQAHMPLAVNNRLDGAASTITRFSEHLASQIEPPNR